MKDLIIADSAGVGYGVRAWSSVLSGIAIIRAIRDLATRATETAVDGAAEQSMESTSLYSSNPDRGKFSVAEMGRRGMMGMGAGVAGKTLLKPLQAGRRRIMNQPDMRDAAEKTFNIPTPRLRPLAAHAAQGPSGVIVQLIPRGLIFLLSSL